MNTAVKTQQSFMSVTATERTETANAKSAFAAFLDELETSRYGFAPMILILTACLGGIAAAFAVQESEIKLMTVAVSTVMVEVLIIAVTPMRIVFWFAVVAVLVDLFAFIF